MATATLRMKPKEAHPSKQPQAVCDASNLLIYPRAHSTAVPLDDAPGVLGGLAADQSKVTLLDLRPNCPSRRVDWRWQLAIRIAAKQKVPNAWKDETTAAAAKLLVRLASGLPKDERYIEQKLPEMAEAHDLRFKSTPALHLEIEARLLANEPLASIAAKTAVSPAVLETYQLLFFDVGDRLTQQGYVMHVAIGTRAHLTWTDDDIQTTGWRLYGYLGGPHVLDALIHGGRAAERPSSPEAVGGFLSASFVALLNSKAALAVHTIDFRNPKNFRRLLRWLMHSQVCQKQKTKLGKVDSEPNLRAFNEQIGVLFKPSCAQPQPVG